MPHIIEQHNANDEQDDDANESKDALKTIILEFFLRCLPTNFSPENQEELKSKMNIASCADLVFLKDILEKPGKSLVMHVIEKIVNPLITCINFLVMKYKLDFSDVGRILRKLSIELHDVPLLMWFIDDSLTHHQCTNYIDRMVAFCIVSYDIQIPNENASIDEVGLLTKALKDEAEGKYLDKKYPSDVEIFVKRRFFNFRHEDYPTCCFDKENVPDVFDIRVAVEYIDGFQRIEYTYKKII